TIVRKHAVGIHSLTWSKSGSIACVDREGSLIVVDPNRKPDALVLAVPSDDQCVAVLSPDGKLLASGGSGGEIVFWDMGTAARIATLCSYTSQSAMVSPAVQGLQFIRDGTLLASFGRAPASVKIWNASRSGPLAAVECFSISKEDHSEM